MTVKNKRCIKCKKILVGNHLILCSNCKRKVGKGVKAIGAGVVFVGGLAIHFVPKKKI